MNKNGAGLQIEFSFCVKIPPGESWHFTKSPSVCWYRKRHSWNCEVVDNSTEAEENFIKVRPTHHIRFIPVSFDLLGSVL